MSSGRSAAAALHPVVSAAEALMMAAEDGLRRARTEHRRCIEVLEDGRRANAPLRAEATTGGALLLAARAARRARLELRVQEAACAAAALEEREAARKLGVARQRHEAARALLREARREAARRQVLEADLSSADLTLMRAAHPGRGAQRSSFQSSPSSASSPSSLLAGRTVSSSSPSSTGIA
ncbi:MAG: hypothetical protein AAF844_16640 [Pseudomonadota bacterium]